ncbi:hypothetical protein D3C71_1459900 [compost metagenome]
MQVAAVGGMIASHMNQLAYNASQVQLDPVLEQQIGLDNPDAAPLPTVFLPDVRCAAIADDLLAHQLVQAGIRPV